MMVIGKVADWMKALDKGMAVVISREDMANSASAYLDSNFDTLRQSDIESLATEINSDYEGFEIWERPDGRWTLERN